METQPGPAPTAKGEEMGAVDALVTHFCLCPPRRPPCPLWAEPAGKRPGLPAELPLRWRGCQHQQAAGTAKG